MTILIVGACGSTSVDMLHVSHAYPFFHRLEVFGDHFTAVSPDSSTLRGLTFDGRELWRRSMVGDPLVGREGDAHLYIQEGTGVFRLSVTDGQAAKLFDVPEHQRFVSDRSHGLVYLVDERFATNAFQLLDPESRRPLWQRDDVESILHVEQNLVVAATATREYGANARSYTTRDVAVIGLDRRAGAIRWRVGLNTYSGFVRAAVVAGCLVVIDDGPGGGLVCIDPVSGRILGKRADPAEFGLSYADVTAEGDRIVFLERAGRDETFLRFASVPFFEITESLRLSANESTFSLNGDYIFLKGLYRAFCFERQSGAKRWERALVGEWSILGDEILLSEYDEPRKHARLVMLDIASGSARVIWSESARVPKPAAR